MLTTEQLTRFRADLDRRQADTRVRRLVDVIDTRIRDGRLVEPANDSARYHIAQLRKLPGATAAGDAAAARPRERRARRGARSRSAQTERRSRALAQRSAQARCQPGAHRRRPPRRATVAVRGEPGAGQRRQPAALRCVQTRIDDGRLLEPAQDSALYHLGQLRAADVSGAQYAASARSALESVARAWTRCGRRPQARSRAGFRHGRAPARHQCGRRRRARQGDRATALGAGRPRAWSAPTRSSARGTSRPEYPRDAMLKNIEGSVKVRFTIDCRRQGHRVRPSCNRRPSVCSTAPRSPP